MEIEDTDIKLYGYDSATDEWYPIQVTVDGAMVTRG